MSCEHSVVVEDIDCKEIDLLFSNMLQKMLSRAIYPKSSKVLLIGSIYSLESIAFEKFIRLYERIISCGYSVDVLDLSNDRENTLPISNINTLITMKELVNDKVRQRTDHRLPKTIIKYEVLISLFEESELTDSNLVCIKEKLDIFFDIKEYF